MKLNDKLNDEFFIMTYPSVNKLTTLNGNEKLYIHEVLSFQLTNKECWYSNADMAKLIGVCIRNVNYIQANLKQKGYITIEVIGEGFDTQGKKIVVTQKLFDEANAIDTKVKKIKQEAKLIDLSNDIIKDEPTIIEEEYDVEDDILGNDEEDIITGEITPKHILIKITKSAELKEDDEKLVLKFIADDSIVNTEELDDQIAKMKEWY